jgi:Flp pilus assembly protein TadG
MKRAFFSRDAEDGAVAVEIALAMGAFLLILFGIIEFSIDLWVWNSMMYAVEETGRCAMAFSQSPTNRQNTTCDNLWSTNVISGMCGASSSTSLQSLLQTYLPGNSASYTLSHTCTAASSPLPNMMTITASYTVGSMSVPGATGSGLIPGFTLTTQAKVPLN